MINKDFWPNLESSDWYEFIHRMLKYSSEIAEKIASNKSVLIHCSDGWDRTAQLAAISQMLIDPYYRTIEGFAVLIEKDWLSFGHQFGLRNGIYLKEQNEDQRSPIFLQFLDCVHQLLHQFPHCFEFNPQLVLFLAKSSCTNLYGTFLFNNENERLYYDARFKTTSVWSDVFINKAKFTNPFYEPENKVEILRPNYATYALVFWTDFFALNSPFIKCDPIYIDETKKESFKSQDDYFTAMKVKDDKHFQDLEKEMETIHQCLQEIIEKTKNTEIFETFDEYTKNYFKYMESQMKLSTPQNQITS